MVFLSAEPTAGDHNFVVRLQNLAEDCEYNEVRKK